MAKTVRPGLRLIDRLILLVAWIATCGVVYLMGFYLGKGTQEGRLKLEERVVRLPVTSTPPAEGQRPNRGGDLSFYEQLLSGGRSGSEGAPAAPKPQPTPSVAADAPAPSPAHVAGAPVPAPAPAAAPGAAPGSKAGAPAPAPGSNPATPAPAAVPAPAPPAAAARAIVPPAAPVAVRPPVASPSVVAVPARPVPSAAAPAKPVPPPPAAMAPIASAPIAPASPPPPGAQRVPAEHATPLPTWPAPVRPAPSAPAPVAATTPPPPTPHVGSWTVEANPTRDRAEAEALQKRLRTRGYDSTLVRVLRDGETWYRLHVGSYGSQEQAGEVMRKLRDGEGVAHAFVASE